MTTPARFNDTIDLGLGRIVGRMHVSVWEPASPHTTLFCLHDFIGVGEDFASLARVLVRDGIRVVAPDLMGRGNSSFLGPDADYGAPTVFVCLAALDRYRLGCNLHLASGWSGILMTAYLASAGWPTGGVILNDVPLAESAEVVARRAALQAMVWQSFGNQAAAVDGLLEPRGLGSVAGADRLALIDRMLMQVDGVWRLRQDPATAQSFAVPKPFDLSGLLCKAPCPLLLLYGTDSPFTAPRRISDLSSVRAAPTDSETLDGASPPPLASPQQIGRLRHHLRRLVQGVSRAG
jgi:pimeloyl-ACP methyl ester carboxylesterase